MKVPSTIILVFLALSIADFSIGEEILCPGQICYERDDKGVIVKDGNVGCCVKMGLECCPDGLYCVKNATAQCTANGGRSPPKKYKHNEEGPQNAAVNTLGRKLLVLKDTKCPGGTCEEDNWFCCPDNNYCAETEADCPNFLASVKKLENHGLLSSFGRRLLSLQGTNCPGGTCEEDNWFCCADNNYCAETEADCPNFVKAANFLPIKSSISTGRKLLSLKNTNCPGGTCEEDNWFCCADNNYCAETEKDCPNF